MFGFSVENTDLFPNIPPSIDPNVIRTQIDLQGWSIESLSPNTTQVTLLEQSDPRGWSNKSSIPQVMMSTLAGIGEFAIKHGAPPLATRLGGAKALASRYDVEKETYRFEFEGAESRRSDSSSTSTAFPLPVAVRSGSGQGSDASSLRSLPAGPKPILNLECEIRCDVDQWANSLAIVIDPPHAAISALKRHRLSQGGGGLWLTIEHDPVELANDKVVVTVRRGAASTSGKTSVVVNGSKIKVDVEDLPETDVKLLKKQKRGRPSRAPLDQPPALGTLRKKQSALELVSANSSHVIDPYKTITPSSTYNRFAQPLSRWYNVAADSTRVAIIPMPPSQSGAASGSTPVDAAVRALGQVARMHTDRDGESTDPFGWQPVSDRDGLKVEKRIVKHVSETFPVFRAGRIIEGFTAEEVSAEISKLSNDERFDNRLRLQSYGPGITTSHLVAHTTFPFRQRSIVLTTIVARLPDGPPPSPSTASHATLTTIFHASTSSFDPLTLGFDVAKYNPASMPNGTVILEGWIIETIDPYSHEHYAIPSTRCMYVASVDYSGSMPLSVNNMLNASLPRALLSVETKLRSFGPPSRSRTPSTLVLAPDPSASGPWAVEGVDAERIGVDHRNQEDTFSVTVIVQPTASSNQDHDSGLAPLSLSLRHSDSKSSVYSGRSTVIDLGEDIRRGRKDLVVMEVEVGQSLVKRGCEIEAYGVSLPTAYNSVNGDYSSILPFTLPGPTLDLPFKVSVLTQAPSVLQSASLDPASRDRHLLRLVLPTSGYELPVIDPLHGQTPPLPRPRWLLDLINDGAVVQLRLKPRTSGNGYRHAGLEVNVEDEKKFKGLKDVPNQLLPRLVG